MKTITFTILFCLATTAYSQFTCDLTKSSYTAIETVMPADVLCIAKGSDKDITLFYTFAYWCSPCRKELPNVVSLTKEQNIDFYILLTHRENDIRDINESINFLNTLDTSIKYIIISDSLYSEKNRGKEKGLIVVVGKREREKYDVFLREITPPAFEHISDMGKNILINKKGEVILVTNYKDIGAQKGVNFTFEKIIRTINDERRVQ